MGSLEPTAWRFMHVAEVYSGKFITVMDLSPTALYELAAPSTPPEDREEIEHATEIRMRAEIRAGELLREMEKNKGAQGSGSNQHQVRSPDATAPPPTLSDLGVTKTQSSRWQKLDALDVC